MTKQYTITHPQKRILYTELINNVPGSYNFVGTMLFPEGDTERIKAAVQSAMAETPNFFLRFHMEDNGELSFYREITDVEIEDTSNYLTLYSKDGTLAFKCRIDDIDRFAKMEN